MVLYSIHYFFWQGLRRRSKQRRKLMHTKKAGGIEETTWDNSACATPMSTMIFFSVLTAGKLERDWYMASGWMTTQSYSIYVSETESCQTNQTINNQFIKQFTTQPTELSINFSIRYLFNLQLAMAMAQGRRRWSCTRNGRRRSCSRGIRSGHSVQYKWNRHVN